MDILCKPKFRNWSDLKMVPICNPSRRRLLEFIIIFFILILNKFF